MKYLLLFSSILLNFSFGTPVFAGAPPPHACDVYSTTDDGEQVRVEYGEQNWECQLANFFVKQFLIVIAISLLSMVAFRLFVSRFVEQHS